MARVARAGRFFGFGLAIYLLSYLYIYDIGVWTLPPASQGAAASLARFSGVSPYLRSSDCFRLVFAHSADHNRKSADQQFGAKERVLDGRWEPRRRQVRSGRVTLCARGRRVARLRSASSSIACATSAAGRFIRVWCTTTSTRLVQPPTRRMPFLGGCCPPIWRARFLKVTVVIL